jgi:hypothetical protein
LFISALKSNTGGGLTKVGEGAKQFAEISSQFKSPSITGTELLVALGASDIQGLFLKLQSFPGMGKKKSALFIRDLYETQSFEPDSRIFKRRFIKPEQMYIPFDVVIANVLNKVFGKILIASQQDIDANFDALTEFAHALSRDDHMILEDLWYWGYFCLKGRGFTRTVELNEPTLYLDDASIGIDQQPGHLRQFISLAESWR